MLYYNLKIPILGGLITTLLTLLSYNSLNNSIHENEKLVTENMKNRIGVEFEWRYTQLHTASIIGYLSGNVSFNDYFVLSQPSLDIDLGSTSIGWFPRVYPEERENFLYEANRLYEDVGYDYSINYVEDIGLISPRPVNSQYMFPLLISNPLTLTYIGLDFYGPTSVNRPDSLMDLAIELKQPVPTDKIIFSLFGGPSNFVDENLRPVSKKEGPVSFLIFHSIDDKDGVNYGVVGTSFEPRGFINEITSSFSEIVTDMEVFVFRRTNFVQDEGEILYELLFDLKTHEEANPFSELTIESVKSRGINSYVSILKSDVGNEISGKLELVVVVTSNTSTDPWVYGIILIIGLLSTLSLWYFYTRVEITSIANKKLSNSKSKFIAEMSHELRTPLNGIMGMTDILRYDEKNLSTVGLECLDDLNTCATFLLSIISEVLDLSKIEAGKIELNIRNEDTREFIEKTVRIMTFYRTLNEKKYDLKLSLTIHDNVPRFMVTDFAKIGKMIMNFVGNSIKFTDSGHISVTVSCETPPSNFKNNKVINVNEEEEELKYIKIVIKDSGKGMSPKSMENLFKPFSQVQLGRSSDGGTGLGLVICKKFAETMGGGIICESHTDIGTTFTSWVQGKYLCNDSPYYGIFEKTWDIKALSKDKVISTSSEENKIVLIVDDVKINVRVMGKLLNSMDISFETSSSGEDAIELCKLKKYNVILMDYFMGGMNGIETAKYIRKTMNHDTNIIIITANEFTDEIRDANVGFLQKPINRESLGTIFRK